MKYLVLVVILAVVVGWFFGRGRRRVEPPPGGPAAPVAAGKDAPKRIEMLACARCGVHLPRSEAAFDAAGRPFCTPEHRVAGPV